MKSKSIVKTLHIICACLWFGTAMCVVLLQCAQGWSGDIQKLVDLNQNFSLLDVSLIIPGAMGSLITGLWICKTTSWGFTRYWWVIAKGIATLSGILVGTALLGPWQMQMTRQSRMMALATDVSSSYELIRMVFTLVSVLQVLLLVFILALSVRKPWGKRLARQNEKVEIERSNLTLS